MLIDALRVQVYLGPMTRLSLVAICVVLAGCGAVPGPEPSRAPDTTTDASTTVVIEISQEPVRVTGYRIGDKVRVGEQPVWVNDDGTVDQTKIPEWIAISRDGIVVGYQHNDPNAETLSPDQIDPTAHPELLISDADGVVIGQFIDGDPTIANGPQP